MNKSLKRSSLKLAPILILTAILLILAYWLVSRYDSLQHICTNYRVIYNATLTTGKLTNGIVVNSGMTYWVNGSTMDQNTDEIFGDLYFPNLYFIKSNQPANITYDSSSNSYTGNGTKLSLYKPGNWYRLNLQTGAWKFYVEGRKDNTAYIRIAECKKVNFL